MSKSNQALLIGFVFCSIMVGLLTLSSHVRAHQADVAECNEEYPVPTNGDDDVYLDDRNECLGLND